MKSTISMLCIVLLSAAVNVRAQMQPGPGPGPTPAPVTDQEKRQVIDTINHLLVNDYIYPEVAGKMVNALSANLKKGNYNDITDPFQFADKVTADLVAVSNDRHFIIQVDPGWVHDSRQALSAKDSLEMIQRDISDFRTMNFGFKELKILPGNIGYLNLIGFCPASYAGGAAVAAMTFLSNTDAIIIDLRTNGGGSSEMVQLLASYFFDEAPRELVGFYDRKTNQTSHDYTLPYLPGKRMPEKKLYILTSHDTFSAAESFTYLMKNRGRATIIGEHTGGGAHPVDQEVVNDRFTIRMPTSRPIDPVTHSDWEGVGIAPDISAPLKEALVTAQIKALTDLCAGSADKGPYVWEIDILKARQHPVTVAADTLKSYAGKYGQRSLLFEDGSLYFQRAGREKHKLIPVGQGLFLQEDVDDVKIKVVVENGRVVALNRLYPDGDSRVDKREE
jgi:prefoldin subunit 5